MKFDPAWRTSTVIGLAQTIRDSRDYSLLKILGDALRDADCDAPELSALDEGIDNPLSGLWLANILRQGQWGECRCPGCSGENSRSQPGRLEWCCPVCGGSGNLLPVVTVPLLEMVREEVCPYRSPPEIEALYHEPERRHEKCDPCSGSGVIHVPSEWLRHLPEWYDVTLENAQPNRFSQTRAVSGPGSFQGEDTHYWITTSEQDRPDRGMWLPIFLRPFLGGYIWDCGPAPQYDSIGHYFSTRENAITALIQSIRRWRFQ